MLVAEERINAAIKKGDFENLEGAGKPLPVDEAAAMPPELRMAYRILKSSGFIAENPNNAPEVVPETALELLRDAPEEQNTYGRIRRLNILSRLSGKPTPVEEDSPYYERVVRRLAGKLGE